MHSKLRARWWPAIAVTVCLAACAEHRDAETQADDAAPSRPAATQPVVAPTPAAAAAHVASDTLLDERPADEDTPSPWLVQVAPAGRLIISPEGLGPVRFGMSFDDVRKALPGATFARGWDGDGVAFVDVARDGIPLMSLHANDDDPNAPFDWSRRITSIQSFSQAAVSADGVAVGDLVADAEKTWGPVREIRVSEIESRQFVEFARQPEWLTIRIDYTGDFAEGARQTRRYKTGARIMSFAIRPRLAIDETQ